ncbi:SBBP repeat-containing protein [Alteribacter aurantiacus]|uniref:DUF7948 domain-containing protein n=1 Tax=Alteribacter aurantiacus TaxID=254410 RepID=UPI00040D537E|nr:SBBP repeat-containing protein [Alteribacter aurantiacus]
MKKELPEKDIQTNRLPLYFIENKGQKCDDILFYAYGADCSLEFVKNGVYLTFYDHSSRGTKIYDRKKTTKGVTLFFRFIGSNTEVAAKGHRKQSYITNYFKGSNPANWLRNVPSFSRVTYESVWPGIDVIFYEKAGKLKYDFVVHPGANVNDIRFKYEGADDLWLSEDGNINLKTPLGIFQDKKPFTYQSVKDKKQEIQTLFTMNEESIFGFAVHDYDPRTVLIIDPGLVYSTYVGGTLGDFANGNAVDDYGNTYVTGFTESSDYPTTPGAFDVVYNGEFDCFVTKLDASGSALVYSTFLGGTGFDEGRDLTVDVYGNAHVVGFTDSQDFPTTPDAFETTLSDSSFDVFTVKLDASGSTLVYSTYVGGIGDDFGIGIGNAVDAYGYAYITGFTNSVDFPTTPGAFDQSLNGDFDGFVTKLDASGRTLVYSTYLGGTAEDFCKDIEIDKYGNAYVTGVTESADYPTTPGAFDQVYNGEFDLLVTKLDASGKTLVYSTFIGGSGFDEGRSITLDAYENAYVTGRTFSADYPTTPGAFDPVFTNSFDVLVTKLSATGESLVYSTYLGGTNEEDSFAIATDIYDQAYVTGFTASSDFPTTTDAFDTVFNGVQDVFLTKMDTSGQTLVYSTYLGGSNVDQGRAIEVDAYGNAYAAGFTDSTDYPTTPGAFNVVLNGGTDVLVTKLPT